MAGARKNQPPRLARALLRWMSGYREMYGMAGDLEEIFDEMLVEGGRRTAARWYTSQVLKALPEYLLVKAGRASSMARSYLRTALRTVGRHKVNSLVNVLGLAIALACAILVFLQVENELSYDSFHANAGRIYGVANWNSFHEQTILAVTAGSGPLMEEQIPGVESAIRANGWRRAQVKREEKVFQESPLMVDPDFFEVFTFPFLAGDPSTALDSRGSVVLTERALKRYFGSADPMGQVLTLDFGGFSKDFIVSGVCETPPSNSTLDFDIVVNIENMSSLSGQAYLQNLRYFDTMTFLLLEESASPEAIDEVFPSFIESNYQATLERWRESGSIKGDGPVFAFHLVNIRDMHMDGDLGNAGSGSSRSLAVLSLIAVLVLAIACINYVNLAIGQSSTRAREVGMRKVLGGSRSQLTVQFCAESLVMALLAMAAGAALAYFLLPVFNELADARLVFARILTARNLAVLAGIWLVVGMAAGAYPALTASGFDATEILKGRFRLGARSMLTRALLTLQFALSVFLLASTLVMGGQIRAMVSKDLGMDTSGVVVVRLQPDDWRSGPATRALLDRFRERLAGRSEIQSITGSTMTFDEMMAISHISIEGETHDVYFNKVDHDFLGTMDIGLVAGRDFSRDFPSDTSSVLVNEKFVERFGLERPVGEFIAEAYYPDIPLQIVGVMEDFNFVSVKYEVAPLIVHMRPDPSIQNMLVRVSSDDVPAAIGLLEDSWKELEPGKLFKYYFLDESIEKAYLQQKRWNSIVKYSSFMAVLITCMGVFALTSMSIARREREISIRKVLGAGPVRIVAMIFREYVLLMALAFAIGWPVSILVMRRWLESFAYRAGMGPLPFVLSGGFVLVVAFATTGLLAARAAAARPAEKLRG